MFRILSSLTCSSSFLSLGGIDVPSHVRRIKLPRIIDARGQVSYKELVGLAVSFVIPERPRTTYNFAVKLTYQDVDDDTVVIGTSEELVDAIEQFSEQRVLRVTAEIKPFTKAPAGSSSKPAPAVVPAPSTDDAPDQPAAPTRSSTHATPVLQNVVESVVNIILNAAVKINSRQGEASAPHAPVFYTPEGELATNAPETELTAPLAQGNAPESTEAETVAATEPETAATSAPKLEEEEKQPFIHGRHTCDGCLVTPIIGKRYHAENMSDYDLCAKCYANYRGDEIKFVPAELDRDRRLQDRWQKRKFCMNKNRCAGRCGPRGPRAGHPGRVGPRGIYRGGSKNCCAHTAASSLTLPVAPRDPPSKTESDKTPQEIMHYLRDGMSPDLALEEAIRRSLEEEKEVVNKASAQDESKVKAAVAEEEDHTKETETESCKYAPEPSAPLEEEARALSFVESASSNGEEIKVETVSENEEIEDGGVVVQADPEANSPNESFASEADDPISDLLGSTLDKCALAIDAMVQELERSSSAASVSTSNSENSYVGVSSQTGGGCIEKATDDAEETEGVTILDPSNDKNGSSEDSNEESDAAERSEGDWQVVSEDNQNLSDEQLARAAQMIGSALFNSDMRSSEELGSAKSGASAGESDVLSVASSVPTTIHSVASGNHVTPQQFEYWAPQLLQLRELGFEDDARCVDILERLSAANIGCGSTDEVTVHQVVDEWYKN